MPFRKIIFWLHLVLGVTAGTVIFLVALTGAILSFEKQIIGLVENNLKGEPVSARLDIETLVVKAKEIPVKESLSGITVRGNPESPVAFSFGRETTFFINPYSGEVLGEGAKRVRDFFEWTTHFHRWLAMEGDLRNVGKNITGASNLVFLGLVITGIYVWFPGRWRWSSFKPILLFKWNLRGKVRDWNWHNVIGFWISIPLFFVITTGTIMSYTWANDLLYRITGDEPPLQRLSAGKEREGGKQARVQESWDGLNEIWKTVEHEAGDDWKLISMRSTSLKGPVAFMVDKGSVGRPDLRAQITVDGKTGQITKKESFQDYNKGRQLRMWSRYVHTGEAGGLVGQAVAGLAALGGVFLVWTGMALAWRRFSNRKLKNGAA